MFPGGLVVLFLFAMIQNGSTQMGVITKKVSKKRLLSKHCYRNIGQAKFHQCFQHCVNDCNCLSYQLCGDTCQLCSSNVILSPADIRDDKNCDNYYFVGAQSCPHDKAGEPDCCAASQPCGKNQQCHAVLPLNSETRYRCKCKPGYQGDGCKPIRSCRGYAAGKRVAGKYVIISSRDEPKTVFCDFDENSIMAWTLVQSYSLSNNHFFQGSSLTKNKPLGNTNSLWTKYRMSYADMTSIKEDSSKWRITCNYNTDNVSLTDYVRASINQVDILTFVGRYKTSTCGCRNVEYINVRGKSCSDCSVCLWQESHYIFLFDSTNAEHYQCSFKPGSDLECFAGEDNFGYYACQNPKHRCTSSPQSTTQTWFGGE